MILRESFDMNQREFENLITSSNYDFLDFGCSKGSSLSFAMSKLGGKKGLGIDIDKKKIEECKKNGHDAILYDLTKLPEKKLVEFCILSHFLEHLSGREEASLMVRNACKVSKKFIYIQQPNFDSDPMLLSEGLKFFWSDWRGHKFNMNSLDLFLVLRDNIQDSEFDQFSIFKKLPITNSGHNSIHSLLSPTDQFEFDEKIHPTKNKDIHSFFPVIHKETVALAGISREIDKINIPKLRLQKKILDCFIRNGRMEIKTFENKKERFVTQRPPGDPYALYFLLRTNMSLMKKYILQRTKTSIRSFLSFIKKLLH